MKSFTTHIRLTTISPIYLILTAFFLCTSFDWPAQDNQALRSEMFTYARQFRDSLDSARRKEDAVGNDKLERAISILDKLIAEEERRESPYKWIKDCHRAVRQLKGLYGPEQEPSAIRQQILRLLDYPLHVNNLQHDAPDQMLQTYYRSTYRYLETAQKTGIKKPKKNEIDGDEVKISKLYNMGFVFRTKEHTVGIDITDHMGLPGKYTVWTDKDFRNLAAQLDLLLLTHPHSDHYTLPMIEAMQAAGKPIVLPCALKGLSSLEHCVIIDSTLSEPVNVAGIELLSFRGNQGETIPNNVYLLDIDGFRIIHNGDNYVREQEALVANYKAADLIIASSWNDVQDILKAAAAAPANEGRTLRFIPAHENELEHSVDHRESYRELYTREDRLGNTAFAYPPTFVLDNGESLKYTPNSTFTGRMP